MKTVQRRQRSVAKWDGSQWSPLGAGVTGGVYGYFYVDALAVTGTNLYAGGYFSSMGGASANYIAQWNGSAWSALSSGMDSEVKTLTFFDGKLYAGGIFTTAGGVPANHIAAALLVWPEFQGSPVRNADGSISLNVATLTQSMNRLYVASNLTPPLSGSPSTRTSSVACGSSRTPTPLPSSANSTACPRPETFLGISSETIK